VEIVPTKEQNLPPLVRGGARKNQEQLKEVLAALKSQEPYSIPGIDDDKSYNALQQRIRQLAKSVGIKVTIRHHKEDQKLYFQGKGLLEEPVEEAVITNKGASKTK
jgi:hypothetical protein